MEDLSKHILDRFQKDIDDLNRCRLELEENLTKHNSSSKKDCPICHSKDIHLNHADKDYRCIKCGYEWDIRVD
jgi:transposase-like protein